MAAITEALLPGLRPLIVAFALMLALPITAPAQKAAIFPFELIDVSIEGELVGHPAEQARLALVTEELRRLAVRDGGYRLVDLSGFAAEIARAEPLHKCDGCETAIARRAGAEIAISGTVRKVSNLILGITIRVRDAESGRLTRVMQASIRGNTDESWLRGVRWLVTNRLLAPQERQ